LVERLGRAGSMQLVVRKEFDALCDMIAQPLSETGPVGENAVSNFEADVTSFVSLIESDRTQSCAAALRVLRRFIETQVDDVSDSSVEWSWDAWKLSYAKVVYMQRLLIKCGAMRAVLSCISSTKPQEIVTEALRTGCALLLGGCTEAQTAFADFSAHRAVLTAVKRRIKRSRIALTDSKLFKTTPAAVFRSVKLELRFLQLVCEGHNPTTQPLLTPSISSVIKYLRVLEKLTCIAALIDAQQALETLCELTQGPCVVNQTTAVKLGVVEIVNDFLSWDDEDLEQRGIPAVIRLSKEAPQLGLWNLPSVEVKMPAAVVYDGGVRVDESGGEAKSEDASVVTTVVLDKTSPQQSPQHNKPLQKVFRAIVNPSVTRLRHSCINLLLSLSEGCQGSDGLKVLASAVNSAAVNGFMEGVYDRRIAERGELDPRKLPVDGFDDADGFSSSLTAGFDAFSLLKTLNYSGKGTAWRYFESSSRAVEVVVASRVQTVYFPRPVVSYFISEDDRARFESKVDRSSRDVKLHRLLEHADQLLEVTQHRHSVSQSLLKSFLNRLYPILRNVSLFLALLLNLIILLGYGSSPRSSGVMTLRDIQQSTVVNHPDGRGDDTNRAISALGSFQIIVTSLTLVLYWITQVPFVMTSRWRKLVASSSSWRHHFMQRRDPLDPLRILVEFGPNGLAQWKQGYNAFTSTSVNLIDSTLSLPSTRIVTKKVSFMRVTIEAWFFLTDPLSFYLFLYWIVAWLGTINTRFWFCLHLLDLFLRLPVLTHILRAITMNFKKLLAVGLIVSLFVLVYSYIAFNAFRDMFIADSRLDPLEPVCDDLYKCFFFTLNSGIRAFGGVGDTLLTPSFYQEHNTYFGRLFFDLTFFIVVILLLVHGGELLLISCT
jgi:RyR and IP3R Homology associated